MTGAGIEMRVIPAAADVDFENVSGTARPWYVTPVNASLSRMFP